MTGKRTIWYWHLLMLIYIAAVAYLCFANLSSMPNVRASYFGIPTDKLVHFAMFFPFPILASLSIRSKGRTPWNAALRTIGIFLLGCIIAAGTELLQGKTGYRTPDAADFRADAVALAIASVISVAVIIIRETNKK